MQVVREHYGHDARQDATMQVRFECSEIALDIRPEGLVTEEGWRITPLTAPTVSHFSGINYIVDTNKLTLQYIVM